MATSIWEFILFYMVSKPQIRKSLRYVTMNARIDEWVRLRGKGAFERTRGEVWDKRIKKYDCVVETCLLRGRIYTSPNSKSDGVRHRRSSFHNGNNTVNFVMLQLYI